MNLKRVFLAATAALMLPGFAMAQGITITFDTQIDSTNNSVVDALATLTCNTGVPLVQSLEITDDQGVVFVVNNFEGSPAIGCSITIDEANTGYEIYEIEANGDDLTAAGACYYTDSAVADESAQGAIENECFFEVAPEAFAWTIEKEWDFAGNVDVSDYVSFDWVCDNVTDDIDDLKPGTITGSFGFYGNNSRTIKLYPNTSEFGGVSTCRAFEDPSDSAVESDQGCASGTAFPVGRSTGGCTVINTVFFEGIPTLSQYGLAIMALLMLGVGFVGFRRFV